MMSLGDKSWRMYCLCLALLMHLAVSGQTSVEFQLYAPTLPDTAVVYIVGNDAQLGSWNPADRQGAEMPQAFNCSADHQSVGL